MALAQALGAVAASPAVDSPIMFSAREVNISGGNINSISGDNNTVISATVNITQAPAPPQEDEVKAVLKVLRDHVTVKTWGVHELVCETRVEGTGEEFDLSHHMEQWRDTKRAIIWNTGNPGTGKTHLASSVFDRLLARTKDDLNTGVSIIYLRYNDKTTDWDIIMGLLIHLVQSRPLPAVVTAIKKAFAYHEKGETRPTFDQLCQLFRSVVRMYDRCYIIIDGLDESTRAIQMMLVNLIATLDANILIMSRVLQLVQDRLKGLQVNRIVFKTVAAHEKDFERYIFHVIDTSPELSALLKDPALKAELAALVKAKAEGMFLHLSLQMEALRDCIDVQSIFDVVNAFPSGIDALYLETLRRIDRQPFDHATRARRALAWILYSRQPLLLDDILRALAAFAPDYKFQPRRTICEGGLATICCGLVAVDYKTRRVRLVHETAQTSLSALLKDQCSAPHEMMAMTCMRVLEEAGITISSLSTLEELQVALASTPMLEYAYYSVGYHVRKGLKEQPSLLSHVLEFLHGCKAFPFHHPLFHPTAIQLLTPLHVAVSLNLPLMVSKLLEDKGVIDVNTRSTSPNGPGWSPLTLACVEGHCDIVGVLLGVSYIQANEGDLTPLMAASHQGHDAIVRALLKSNTPMERALASASKLVGASTRARFIDVNRVDRAGETALIMAARNGHTPVVASLLAEPDIELRVRSRRGETAYILAIKGNHLGVVEVFHSALNLDVNAQDDGKTTPLMVASYSGSFEVVKAILAIPGVDLTLRNIVGHTALSLASWRGHHSILDLLLAVPGVDPNLCRAEENQQLLLASGRGETETVKLLLAVPGVNPNLCTNGGNSALMCASWQGYTDIVKLLLTAPGLDPNLRNNDGDLALIQASWQGHIRVVKLLLTAPGLDLNLRDNNGDSALMRASWRGNTDIVKLLLAAPGVDLNLCNDAGNSALMSASWQGYPEIVRLLLAAPGIDPNLRNKHGNSALMRASWLGQTEVVNLLLAAPGIDLDLRNAKGQSAFQLAQSEGRWDVVTLLEVALSVRSPS